MNEVYLITNRVNGKRYVGITSRNYEVRFREHVNEALNGSKSILHNAIRKYGPDNFDVILLESGISDENACDKEMYYIKLYNTFYTSKIGYNMTLGGMGVVGHRHDEVTRKKISEGLKGHKFPSSRNEKIRNAMMNREYKDEWKQALSKCRLGRFKGPDNPFYGKTHSVKQKQAVSKANTKHSVIQLDPKSKEIIRKFDNCGCAGKWIVENGYSTARWTTCEGRIGEVCRRGSKECIAYGFSWIFEEGQSTNCKAENELPSEVQSTVIAHGDDIVSTI